MRALFTVLVCLCVPGLASAAGTVVLDSLYSQSLGEVRCMTVYLPEGYDPQTAQEYPVAYFLHGYGGDHLENGLVHDVLDELIGAGAISPIILVKPDGGAEGIGGEWRGSWWTNSLMYGNTEDFLVLEVVDHVDSHYKTIADPDYRAIMGHSMGGFGAMKQYLKHADRPDGYGYIGVASHSGALDLSQVTILIPYVLGENPPGEYHPSAGTATEFFFSWAGAFSPNLDNPPYYVDFLLDPWGAVIDSVWDKWMLHNPAEIAESFPAAVEEHIYFDCGLYDEFLALPFNVAFADSLDALGMDYIFETFPGGHALRPERFRIGIAYLDSIMHLPTTYIVNPAGTGDFPTIQAAIDAASDGDIIQLANGTFRGDGNRDINFRGKAITVCAESENPKNCIIDCEGTPEDPHRGFRIDSGEGPESVLEGITITGGYAPMALSVPAGGAVFVTGHYDPLFWTSPTIRNCRFIDNDAPYAIGGVDFFFSNSTIEDCYFSGNRALGWGAGALGTAGFANVTISNCTFVDNWSWGSGAAIGSGFFEGDPSTTTITDCHFEGNHSESSGGGIANHFSTTVIVERSTFVSNVADTSGGAAAAWGGASMVFDECTFWNNSALSGGAIALRYDLGGGLAEVNNCTFYGNRAAEGSGLLAMDDCVYSIANTIVSFGEDGAAYFGPPVVDFSCSDIFGNDGGDWVGAISGQLGINGNIALDPYFVNPGKGQFILKDRSPCAPFSPPNEECDLIGAWPVGDGDGGDGHAADNDGIVQAHGATIQFDSGLFPIERTGMGMRIRYALTEAAHAQVVIYDASGRALRHLVNESVAAGVHTVIWGGRDDAGRPVSSGVYFSQLRANGRPHDMQRVVVLR